MSKLHAYLGPVESPQPESGVFPAGVTGWTNDPRSEVGQRRADGESDAHNATVRLALLEALVAIANAAAILGEEG